MEDLAFFNTPSPCIGHPDENIVGDHDLEINCNPPYDLCFSRYCPEVYCKSIEMLVDLNIQLVARAATAWFHESGFFLGEGDGNPYYNSARQLVCDINAAYDCAGLRRPIIQAGIFEGAAEGVNQVPIPEQVIEVFIQDMSTSEKMYYLDGLGRVKSDLKFKHSRMFENLSDGIVDLTKMETQLWFYYQAKTFIDFGYKALHMGIYYAYAQNDVGYDILYKLTKKIRDYAVARGSFVLLSGENRGLDQNGNPTSSARWLDTDQLIFDFDGRAMRPREISNPQVLGDGGCNSPIHPDNLALFERPPCNEENQPAIIDQCVVNHFGGNRRGISPSGCIYSQVPYFVYFDFGIGLPRLEQSDDNGCDINWDQVGVPSSGNPASLVWGQDDTKWFAESLSSDCKEAWWQHFYCQGRDYHGGNGFLQIPGILNVPTPENLCGPDLLPASWHGNFVLADYPAFVESINQVLTPENPGIKITENLIPFGCIDECDGEIPPLGQLFEYLIYEYVIEVINPDCSSTYSIHIQRPNGGWVPKSIGRRKNFAPLAYEEGEYKIYIRQDNMALDPATFGTLTIDTTFYFRQDKCGNLYREEDCDLYLRYYSIISYCQEEDNIHKYFAEITLADTIDGSIVNITNISDFNWDITQDIDSPGKINASLPRSESIESPPSLKLLIEFEKEGAFFTRGIQENLGLCESSLSNKERDLDVKLYPNPFTDELSIEYVITQPTNIEELRVYNSSGILVFQEKNSIYPSLPSRQIRTYQLNSVILTPGFYFAEVIIGDKKIRKKLVKQPQSYHKSDN